MGGSFVHETGLHVAHNPVNSSPLVLIENLLPTRLLLLHGQFLSVLCTQCYLAGRAVNVNLSLNPQLKGGRPNKRCQFTLADALTDAVGLLIHTFCMDV